MSDRKPVDVGNAWWFWFTTNAFAVDCAHLKTLAMIRFDWRDRK